MKKDNDEWRPIYEIMHKPKTKKQQIKLLTELNEMLIDSLKFRGKELPEEHLYRRVEELETDLKMKHSSLMMYKDKADSFAAKYYILLSESEAKKHNNTLVIILLLFVILFLSIIIFNN